MKIRFSIPVLKWLKAAASDFTLSGDEIVEENHHKHFLYTFYIFLVLFPICAILDVMQVRYIHFGYLTVLGWLGGLIINATREGWKSYKGGKLPNGMSIVPFCWRDVRFGSYGGFTAGLITGILINIAY